MSIYKSAAGAREIEENYREALRAWPVPNEQFTVATRQGETFVVASGPPDAPPVVMLHGSGSNATTWGHEMPLWARHRTYAVDIVGEPGSSAPSRPPLASDAYAQWLDDVMAALSLPTAAFVGMSLGGWVAIDYATRRPERVTSLALLCPGGIGRQTYGWLPAAAVLRLFGRRGRRRTARMVTGLDTPETDFLLDDVVRTFTHFAPRTERLPIFSDEDLCRLAMPVQVIVGDRDAMFDSAETVRRVRGVVPHADVIELSDVGHAVIGCGERTLVFVRENGGVSDGR